MWGGAPPCYRKVGHTPFGDHSKRLATLLLWLTRKVNFSFLFHSPPQVIEQSLFLLKKVSPFSKPRPSTIHKVHSVWCFLTSTNTWFLWQAQLNPGQPVLWRIQYFICLSPTLGYLRELFGWQTVGSPENQTHKNPCPPIICNVTHILRFFNMNTFINS